MLQYINSFKAGTAEYAGYNMAHIGNGVPVVRVYYDNILYLFHCNMPKVEFKSKLARFFELGTNGGKAAITGSFPEYHVRVLV